MQAYRQVTAHMAFALCTQSGYSRGPASTGASETLHKHVLPRTVTQSELSMDQRSVCRNRHSRVCSDLAMLLILCQEITARDKNGCCYLERKPFPGGKESQDQD